MIPTFHTVAWVSQDAKKYWNPIFDRLCNSIFELERYTVIQGIRQAAVQILNNKQLYDASIWCHERGLRLLPIEGAPDGHRVIITKHSITEDRMIRLWEKRDEKEIGKILGYPECCIDWFVDIWKNKRLIDTCISMGEGIHRDYFFTNNILLRDFGIRDIFHLPCSFDCVNTNELAHKIFQVSSEYNLKRELQTINGILQWPMKYSSLHGVAEITTPIMKIRRKTDYLPKEGVIELHGKNYPEYGASGIKFPFQKNPQRNQFALFLKPDIWSDNGFSNMADMEKAHEFILNGLENIIDKTRSQSLVDLGCGNGELLRKIRERFPNVAVTGVDQDVDKIERAKSRVSVASFKVDNVLRMEFDKTYDIALISINRFQGLNEAIRLRIRRRLRRIFRKIVVYSYDEMRIKEVEHGWDQEAEGTASRSSKKAEPSSQRDEFSRNADDGNRRTENEGTATVSLSDRKIEARDDSDKR